MGSDGVDSKGGLMFIGDCWAGISLERTSQDWGESGWGECILGGECGQGSVQSGLTVEWWVLVW